MVVTMVLEDVSRSSNCDEKGEVEKCELDFKQFLYLNLYNPNLAIIIV